MLDSSRQSYPHILVSLMTVSQSIQFSTIAYITGYNILEAWCGFSLLFLQLTNDRMDRIQCPQKSFNDITLWLLHPVVLALILWSSATSALHSPVYNILTFAVSIHALLSPFDHISSSSIQFIHTSIVIASNTWRYEPRAWLALSDYEWNWQGKRVQFYQLEAIPNRSWFELIEIQSCSLSSRPWILPRQWNILPDLRVCAPHTQLGQFIKRT